MVSASHQLTTIPEPGVLVIKSHYLLTLWPHGLVPSTRNRLWSAAAKSEISIELFSWLFAGNLLSSIHHQRADEIRRQTCHIIMSWSNRVLASICSLLCTLTKSFWKFAFEKVFVTDKIVWVKVPFFYKVKIYQKETQLSEKRIFCHIFFSSSKTIVKLW